MRLTCTSCCLPAAVHELLLPPTPLCLLCIGWHSGKWCCAQNIQTAEQCKKVRVQIVHTCFSSRQRLKLERTGCAAPHTEELQEAASDHVLWQDSKAQHSLHLPQLLVSCFLRYSKNARQTTVWPVIMGCATWRTPSYLSVVHGVVHSAVAQRHTPDICQGALPLRPSVGKSIPRQSSAASVYTPCWSVESSILPPKLTIRFVFAEHRLPVPLAGCEHEGDIQDDSASTGSYSIRCNTHTKQLRGYVQLPGPTAAGRNPVSNGCHPLLFTDRACMYLHFVYIIARMIFSSTCLNLAVGASHASILLWVPNSAIGPVIDE